MSVVSQATSFLNQCVFNAQLWFRSSTNFLGKLAHANTADRTYTFPDKDGTIADIADVAASATTVADTTSVNLTLAGVQISGVVLPAGVDHNSLANLTVGDVHTQYALESALGTMSTQAANNVAVTGGSVTGITDLAVADGGTGASTAADARSNLGLGTLATQSGTFSGTSSGTNTGDQTLGSLGLDSGPVVQRVLATLLTAPTGTTTIPLDDTIPQNTEGDEYITLAITPTSASNLLEIEAQFGYAGSAALNCIMALFQDTTTDALKANSFTIDQGSGQIVHRLFHSMTAGTTSSTTFKIRIGPSSAGTLTMNGFGAARKLGGVAMCYILIKERLP